VNFTGVSWRAGTTQIKRRIGPKRTPPKSDGLTRSHAEAELRKMIGAIGPVAARAERVTVAEVGELLVESVRAKGRAASGPRSRPTSRACACSWPRSSATAPSTRSAAVSSSSSCAHGPHRALAEDHPQRDEHPALDLPVRPPRGLGDRNPCTLVDKPRADTTDPDIRFLEREEIEALLRGVPGDDLAASSGACTSPPR